MLAVDGGNSKADLALVGQDGSLLAVVHGPTVSHQQVGIEVAMSRLRVLVGRAAERAGLSAAAAAQAEVGLFCLAGADLPADTRLLTGALGQAGIARSIAVLNDSRAGLRAGSERGWGVIVICGAGVNCSGVAADGRTASLRALGPISGDWGGGGDLGRAALAAAVRARDGRGPRTLLERTVPAHFKLARPIALTEALHTGRIDEERLRELAPVVFAAAVAGDAVARGIVDRLADELATMAIAIIRRLRLIHAEFDLVLAGGVFRTWDAAFIDRLTDGVQAVASHARITPLRQPPLLGAALLGLDRLSPSAGPGAARRLRRAFAALED